MYGSHSEVLKTKGNIELRRNVRHSHGFTSKGRGTIKTKITYDVSYTDSHLTENYSGRYNMTSKAEALRIFSKVTKFGMGSLVQAVG